MTFTPWDWQLTDVATLRAHNYTALLNIDPGGTKTAISTLAMKDGGASTVLVTAPQSTHTSAWIPTVAAILGVEARVIGNKNKATREALRDFELGVPGWFLTTHQFMARTDTSNWSGDALIVDESHQVTTMGSKASRALAGYTSPQSKREALNTRFDSRLALSGTPARQNFENLWATMRFLWPDLDERDQVAYQNPFIWMADRMEYETVYTNQRDSAGNVKTAKKWLAEKAPGLLVSQMPCCIVHKRREACCVAHPAGFLPLEEPQVIDRIVELAPAQNKAIRELQDHMMTYLAGEPLVTELSITQQARIRQICLGVPSIEYTDEGNARVEFAEDCVSPFIDETFEILSELPVDEAVVIYLDSRRFAEVVTKRLNARGITAAEFSGATVRDRGQYLEEFGTKYRVLVMVSSSGATGTDGLQTKSSTEIILETPVSLTVKTQAESRQDRIGASKRVQRFRVLDSLGYAQGRLDDHLLKQLSLNRSLRKAV